MSSASADWGSNTSSAMVAGKANTFSQARSYLCLTIDKVSTRGSSEC